MSWSAMRWATDRRDAGSGRRVSSTRRSSWRIVRGSGDRPHRT
jgi:hypothetical protein